MQQESKYYKFKGITVIVQAINNKAIKRIDKHSQLTELQVLIMQFLHPTKVEIQGKNIPFNSFNIYKIFFDFYFNLR